ncbi:hypothetical protein [Micromonospora sp. CPCC 206061]|uniref:hypothetical protein n=1 Tax=Micromonospora sp. CPCC 206061 TaxID=3122410 RepID=UPI002FF0D60A
MGGVAAALLAVVGGTAAYAYAGEVPRGTTVLGIDIGGRSRTDAAEALRAGLAAQADRLAAAIPVRLGDNQQISEVKPAEIGLSVDVEATVVAAADGPSSPFRLLFGSHTVEPVVTVDAARVLEVLSKGLGPDAQEMKMPAITFNGTTPKATYPKPGRGLDVDKAAQELRAGWLGTYPLAVPLAEVRPATSSTA